MIKKVLMIVLIVLVAAITILIGSSLNLFIDIPSLIVSIGIPLFTSLFVYKFKEVVKYKKIAFSTGDDFDLKDLKCAEDFFNLLIYSFLASGFLAFFIGGIQILQALKDPGSLGPAIAVALITVFYSSFFIALILPMKFSVRRKVNSVGG